MPKVCQQPIKRTELVHFCELAASAAHSELSSGAGREHTRWLTITRNSGWANPRRVVIGTDSVSQYRADGSKMRGERPFVFAP
jgi:hypothetical protein